VPAAEVAGQQHDEQDDAADQAHGLRGGRALLGLVVASSMVVPVDTPTAVPTAAAIAVSSTAAPVAVS